MIAATASSPRSGWLSVRKCLGSTAWRSARSAAEMLFDLDDRLGAIRRFRIAVVLVDIEHERAIANGARIRRVEIVRQILLHPWPIGHQIAVMWIEPDSFGKHRVSKVLLAAGYPLDIDQDRINERRIVR